MNSLDRVVASVAEADVALAAKLNLLPEVRWDRWGGWYAHPKDSEDEKQIYSAWVFGWILREDRRFDFATMNAYYTVEDGLYHAGVSTSSAKFSAEFARRLENETHLDCRRVEGDPLGGLVDRIVELENRRLDDGPRDDKPYERPKRESDPEARQS